MKENNIKGSFFLLMAALIWGITFVFQDILIGYNLGTLNFIFFRSIFGCITVAVIISIRKLVGKDKYKEEYHNNKKRKSLLFAGVICGFLMAIACGAQQQGMKMYPQDIAVVGRTAFLTSTYVVLTALIQTIIGNRPHLLIILSTVLSMIGIYFLSYNGEISGVYFADIIVFICVIAYTISILVIDKFSFLDSLRLSFLQLVFAAIFVLPFMIVIEGVQYEIIKKGIMPLLFIGVFSSGIAYTFQIVGQKFTEPTVAVLIMCMESVFAAVFAFLILGQKMSFSEKIGASLVIIAIILAQIPNLWYNKKKRIKEL